MKMPNETELRTVLRQVIDPEIGINIVDLGLVYRVDVMPEAVEIDITATSPACPMGALLMEEVEAAAASVLAPDSRVDVRLVWDPPWTPERMSGMARVRLGW
jgi:metal-sulfur cluster biosynthetic enzyme